MLIKFLHFGKEITQDLKKNDNSVITKKPTIKNTNIKKFNANKIIDNMMKSPNWSKNKYYGKTKEEIKALWKENGQEAA